ncbi:MAG: WecB/TagA/CpsF family glycosyltransferase [Chloroflexota bacterium]
MTAARFNVIGVGVSLTNLSEAVATILTWRVEGARESISTCTAYTLVECRRNPALRSRINSAGLATPDGMPLVWLGRQQGHHKVSRVYGPDLMLAVCKAGLSVGLRHFFYGGAPGVPERLAARLQTRFPTLQIAGTLSPLFHALSNAEDAAMVERINATQPDVVWVGLGTPKQDFWVADHRGRVHATALIAVGAAFDFLSGRVQQAPPWIQRCGFEWLFRLVQEPRRLWRRYLVDNAIFLFHVGLQRAGIREYPIETEAY